MARLHDNGRALVATLRDAGPIVLVLDECHHLLEVWGRLLGELLEQLPDAVVLGLTATPPETMTKEQAALVAELFGEVVFETSIPAVVREGDLAPFAELAWLTVPTAAESDWLASEATRFRELVTQLTDPTFGSVPFLAWLDARFRSVEAPWPELVRREPELCAAALRMHHAGLLALPDLAVPTEEHRRDPTADDWVLLVGDWQARHLSRTGDPRDQQVVDAVRRALPAVGYVATKRGIRRGRSPVDRVLARSEAKTTATVAIVSAEHLNLGDRLRMLVLCDHERASATLPVDLRGVLDQESGSAHAVLAALLADPVDRGAGPAAGHRAHRRRVAADAGGAPRLRPRPPGPAGRAAHRRDRDPGRLVVEPALGARRHPLLRGRRHPGAGRHAWAAGGGLGRAPGDRARRPDRGDDHHRRRADARAGAAHRPVLAGEGRAHLVGGVRVRRAPQGRQRLGPAGAQAQWLLRPRRARRRGRRGRAPRPGVLGVRAARGRRVRCRQRAHGRPQRGPRGHPSRLAGGGAVRRPGRPHRSDPAVASGRARTVPGCRRSWPSAPGPPRADGPATADRGRGPGRRGWGSPSPSGSWSPGSGRPASSWPPWPSSTCRSRGRPRWRRTVGRRSPRPPNPPASGGSAAPSPTPCTPPRWSRRAARPSWSRWMPTASTAACSPASPRPSPTCSPPPSTKPWRRSARRAMWSRAGWSPTRSPGRARLRAAYGRIPADGEVWHPVPTVARRQRPTGRGVRHGLAPLGGRRPRGLHRLA